MPITTDFDTFLLRCIANGATGVWVEENTKCETCEVNQQIPFSEYCQKCIDEWSDVEDSEEEDSEEEVSKYLNLDKYICEDCNRDFTEDIDGPSETETWDEHNRLMCQDCFQIGNY
mgnify:CR=1 FL=1